MPNTFTEWLIIILVGLLFGKDYILSPILAKWGIKVNGKENGYQPQIDELKEHARIANQEMGEIRKDISDIKSDVAYIRGKLDK